MHDGADESDWATQHVARVFEAHPEFLEQYLTFYYPESVSEEQATGVWKDDFVANPDYSPAERTAVEFAERMAIDHHNIGDADIEACASTSTTPNSSS
jgi:hypothetical protein